MIRGVVFPSADDAMPPRRTAVVDDLRIAFEESGSGAPTVVLIHGGFANRSHFRQQTQHLALRHRTLAVDLRGHGESDAPNDAFGVRDFARDVIGVCESARVERAVLCGHSVLGGAIALEVAATRPALVAGVALLDAGVLFPEAIRTRALSLVPALSTDGWAEALHGYFSRMFGRYDPPALKDRIFAEIDKAPRQMAAPLWRDLMSSDYAAQLSSGDYPLLYVHAGTPTDLARLQQLRPDAIIASVAGSGHYLHLVVPEQVNAMLDRFLEIVASRPTQ